MQSHESQQIVLFKLTLYVYNNNMENLLKKCLYYKGERKCPDNIVKVGKSREWFFECKWVEFGGIYEDNGEYEWADLMDFEKDDDVPLSLKKLLFNRYIQDLSLANAAPGFKVYYYEFYCTLKTDFKHYFQSLKEANGV